MSLMIYPKIARHCGTCRYWMGIRKNSGSSFEVDASSYGKCCHSGNPSYFNKDIVAYKECPKWTKV